MQNIEILNRAGGCCSVVECLLRMHEALASIPSTAETKSKNHKPNNQNQKSCNEDRENPGLAQSALLLPCPSPVGTYLLVKRKSSAWHIVSTIKMLAIC